MSSSLTINRMTAEDIECLARAFAAWNKTRAQYERYFQEQESGRRLTLIAWQGESLAGYGNLIWQPDYEPFRQAGLPEIQDLNVLACFQKRGIGTALIGAAESLAVARGKTIMGIGVGQTPDYAAAQRLYPRLGYVPDGRGPRLTPWGDVVYLTKTLME